MRIRFVSRRFLACTVSTLAFLSTRPLLAAGSPDPIETIEVRGSLEQVREQVQSFVSEVTRNEGELIGRWDTRICLMIAGVSDDQAAFMRHRLFEVEAEARKRRLHDARACKPNLFVIVTPEPEQVIEAWKARDPTMFRWKSPEWVTRSSGDGPVRTWHNATEVATGTGFSRIEGKYSEFINNVVVLVDASRTSGKSLSQITDYIALVSLSQIDASADTQGVQSILQLFASAATSTPATLTDWDLALLHGLYRTSYTPAHQRADLMARMARELAPRDRTASGSSPPDAPTVVAAATESSGVAAANDRPAAAEVSIGPPAVPARGIDPRVVTAATNNPLETVVVRGSRAEVRKQVEAFVAKVTRLDGDLIGRWRDPLCPLVAGLSDSQNAFVRNRLLEVEAKVRKRPAKPDRRCQPNAFVVITDDADKVLADWTQRAPALFRWKTSEDIHRSDDAGPVRIWHNAVMLRADDGPWVSDPTGASRAPSGRLKDSRIVGSAKEAITAVVVLLDAQKMGKVTLVQTADYLAFVSLSQVDLRADVGTANTILKLFTGAETGTAPAALTEWDYAFLNALYRVGYYSPAHQRMDITARMSRELAPR